MKTEMQKEEIEQIGIGKDEPQIEAKDVTVVEYKIEEVTVKGKTMDKLVLICSHPDQKEYIEINGVRYLKGNVLKDAGLWLKLDKDGLLFYRSAISALLRQYKADFIYQLRGRVLNTLIDDKGYLAIKCY